MNTLKTYHYPETFELESGESIRDLQIAYHTYGKLNREKSNVIWVCHALTANSDPVDWWPGLVGKGYEIDPDKFFIVCANVLGSCYGTTGPRSIDPKTGEPYGLSFPKITVRDSVKAHAVLAKKLGIDKISLVIGGSYGGFQALEFTFLKNIKVENLALVATGAKETAWAISIHEAQRMALEADQTFYDNEENTGRKGLEAARGMGLVTYRTFEAYKERQTDDDGRIDDFRASSYIRYQGKKLADRFHAHNYWYLSKCLDSHNIGRDRGGVKNALSKINIPVSVIGISTDHLVPTSEQKFLAKHIPNARYHEVDSDYGHDGFLIEAKTIGAILKQDFEHIFVSGNKRKNGVKKPCRVVDLSGRKVNILVNPPENTGDFRTESGVLGF